MNMLRIVSSHFLGLALIHQAMVLIELHNRTAKLESNPHRNRSGEVRFLDCKPAAD